VSEKWECVFDQEMHDNREMYDFLVNHPMVETPLDTRDAFFDGRTGNIATQYEVMGTVLRKYVTSTYVLYNRLY